MKGFVCLLIVLVLTSTMVFAGGGDLERVNREVNKVNEQIEFEIEKAVKKVDKLIENNDGKTNETVDQEIDRIVNKLVEKTNDMANKVIEKAAREGIEVECEYVEVEIGGRTVLIDPLRIVND